MSLRHTALVSGALILLPAGSLAAQDHPHHGGPERLGRVEFATSCNAEAQPRFERALALLHSFWWSEAGRAFAGVLEADPDCAIALWGSALVERGNWFAGPPSAEAVARGLAAAERGLALQPRTERERGYLEAVATLFRDGEQRDHRTRSLAYEEAMRALHERYPDDVEAAVFYALSITANAQPADRTFERQRRAGAILEPHFRARPDHPGLAHYLIHTYDAPPIAHLGEEAARQYGGIAPSVPHAQHMPSHIFTRLGLWDESIEANAASAESARAYELQEGMTSVSFDRAHAWDYLVYAYLQQGRDAAAGAVLDTMRGSTAAPSIATDYAFAAIPARMALERERWAEAAALPLRRSPGFIAGEAITHFARGVGAARSGDAAAARTAMAALAEVRDTLERRGETYWREIVEAQRLSVAAWIALGEGNAAEALALVARAAEIEERVDKHPVTPGPILPAREMEGDMLLQLERPAEAMRAYDAALQHDPNRARSMFGSARAAELAGMSEEARTRYARYLELMTRADGDRPQLAAARRFREEY
jgi:tetratricopeptide (TPR) repeat protein